MEASCEKVSVIIPVYNAESTIEKAVKSVLNQTYLNCELIIINDGSIDNTVNVLSDISDRKIRVVSQQNSGVSASRNKGIDLANGEFIVFLDADDKLNPDALETMVHAITNTNADICSANHSTYKGDKKITEAAPLTETVVNGQEMLKLCLEDYITTHHVWATIFRKSFIGNTRFREDCIVHEDSFFMAELAMKEPIYSIINTEVYQYHISEHSVSRSGFSSRKADDILRLAGEINGRVDNKFPQLKYLVRNYMIKANMSILKNCPEHFIEKQCLTYVRNNRNYFIPDSTMDRILFSLIKYHLYGIYKLAYRFKFQS